MGKLVAGQVTVPCSLGRSGITHAKREGDGATPAGRHRLIGLFARADRTRMRSAPFPFRLTKPVDGWCDDPSSDRYNRYVRLPVGASSETLYREDRLYDTVLVLDWNVKPRIRRFGSAIFMHLTREDRGPTAGCIALHPNDMRRLLPRLARRCHIVIR